MKKKSLAIILSVATLCGALAGLAGCGSGGDLKETKGELTIPVLPEGVTLSAVDSGSMKGEYIGVYNETASSANAVVRAYRYYEETEVRVIGSGDGAYDHTTTQSSEISITAQYLGGTGSLANAGVEIVSKGIERGREDLIKDNRTYSSYSACAGGGSTEIVTDFVRHSYMGVEQPSDKNNLKKLYMSNKNAFGDINSFIKKFMADAAALDYDGTFISESKNFGYIFDDYSSYSKYYGSNNPDKREYNYLPAGYAYASSYRFEVKRYNLALSSDGRRAYLDFERVMEFKNDYIAKIVSERQVIYLDGAAANTAADLKPTLLNGETTRNACYLSGSVQTLADALFTGGDCTLTFTCGSQCRGAELAVSIVGADGFSYLPSNTRFGALSGITIGADILRGDPTGAERLTVYISAPILEAGATLFEGMEITLYNAVS